MNLERLASLSRMAARELRAAPELVSRRRLAVPVPMAPVRR